MGEIIKIPKKGKLTKTDTKKPIAIDLFCGCGGLTLGLKRAGFKVILGIDADPLAIETYEANHPECVALQKDITKCTVPTILKKLKLEKGKLDLLAGCPPCQGFSPMRTLNRSRIIKDKRNNLLNDFIRFVKGMGPKIVMMENVVGLSKHSRFRKMCSALQKLGYKVNWGIKDASDYRVPQRRRRLILIASKSNVISFAQTSGKRVTVASALRDLPKAGSSGDPLHDFPENRSKKVIRLIKAIPKNGGSRTDLPSGKQLNCHRKCSGFKDVYGRMAWNTVAPTITTGCFNPSKGRFLHPVENRAITMREASLLQGFPKSYKFPCAKSKIANARLIGNALPPPFIAAHAKLIYTDLTKPATK